MQGILCLLTGIRSLLFSTRDIDGYKVGSKYTRKILRVLSNYKGEFRVGSSYFWRHLNVFGSVILLNSFFFIEPTLQVGRNKNLQLVVLRSLCKGLIDSPSSTSGVAGSRVWG